MFLVGIAGPHLAVSGAVFAETFISQRLTDYIHLGPLPTVGERFPQDNSTRRIAQVLRALREATKELENHYSGLEFKPPPIPKPHSSTNLDTSRGLPIPSNPIPLYVVPPSFQSYGVEGKQYVVSYERRLAPSFPVKAVFKGTVTCEEDGGKSQVVIKFTPKYCEDAHRKIAEAQLAPSLQYCKYVESVGMYVVVMGFEDGKPAEKPLTDEEHTKQLRTAMKTLHDEDYVHGDLRGPNVLITANGLKIIDFDWCGKAGTARYPSHITLAPDLEWHDGVEPGGLITKEHDQHMLEVLVRPYP